MTENEQLRMELNELRERVAVLENQRVKPAPAPAGPLASLGAMAEQARKQQRQAAELHRHRFTDWNQPQPTTLGSGVIAQGLSSDGHLGLLVGALNTQMPNLGDVHVNNPGVRHGVYRSYGPGAEKELMACGCGSPHCTPFIPPEGGSQV